MVDKQNANLPHAPRPLSNSEVKQLIEMHLSNRAQMTSSAAANNDMLGNEQGIDLRTQTTDYIEMFNDFELHATINDIRR